MKPKALMLLAVAIGCGLVAMLGVQQAMQGSQPKEVPIETRKVLVALKDIKPSEPLTEENVVLKDIPVTALAAFGDDVVVTVEEYAERALMITATKGDPIHKSKLTEKGAISASSQIPKGMRIFTFSVSDAQTHSGMLRAGDKVDVTVAFTNRRGIMENKVLLECIKIFASENKTERSEDGKNEQRARNVSLLVTPEQDGFVKIAQSRGQLSLALRHPDDDEIINAGGVNSQALDDLKSSVGSDDHPGYGRRIYDDGESVSPKDESVATPEVVAPSTHGPAATPTAPMNVQSFLQSPAAPAAAPATPKWTMKIYNGNESLDVQVDEVVKPQPENAATPTSDGIPGLLKSLWSPAPSASAPSDVTPSTDPVDLTKDIPVSLDGVPPVDQLPVLLDQLGTGLN